MAKMPFTLIAECKYGLLFEVWTMIVICHANVLRRCHQYFWIFRQTFKLQNPCEYARSDIFLTEQLGRAIKLKAFQFTLHVISIKPFNAISEPS